MSAHERDTHFSRRAFLVSTTGLWISAGLPRPLAAAAAQRDEAPSVLSPDEWSAVEAISERILPADETPGAKAAGCVNFIDKALASEDAAALPLYREALQALEHACDARWKKKFVDLDAARQDAMLEDLESGSLPDWGAPGASQQAFFGSVRMHTLLGFLADPRHGGNRDFIGWRTMGFPGPVHHLGGAQPDQMSGKRRFAPIWERTPPRPSQS
ncbi:MAG: gluconate 2-dehydrogenase subunit 3 family protein [Deltaproteobacteria bacterium]|nr:gluconate 2-dehydrogenase subunit 3 family protein [Deltaproteobacteria bacterium]